MGNERITVPIGISAADFPAEAHERPSGKQGGREMKDESIAIELRLTAEEIAMLADESESTENPELAEFLSKVLRLADKAAYEMGDIILKIKKANPYTNQHKEM